jgi:hypothetical protein
MNSVLTGSTMNIVTPDMSCTDLGPGWKYFTVLRQASNVYLQWAVTGSQLASDFTIQHSGNGSCWVNIEGRVAAGSNTVQRQFCFVHADPLKGINYYRICFNQRDKTPHYSDLCKINFEGDSRAFTIENAVTNSLIKIHIRKPSNLIIFTSNGKTIHRARYAPGLQTIEVAHADKGICWIDADGQREKVLVI